MTQIVLNKVINLSTDTAKQRTEENIEYQFPVDF